MHVGFLRPFSTQNKPRSGRISKIDFPDEVSPERPSSRVLRIKKPEPTGYSYDALARGLANFIFLKHILQTSRILKIDFPDEVSPERLARAFKD